MLPDRNETVCVVEGSACRSDSVYVVGVFTAPETDNADEGAASAKWAPSARAVTRRPRARLDLFERE